MPLANQPARILLIEDSEIDTFIFHLVIRKTLDNPIIESFRNGADAIERLISLKSNGYELLPDFIFLDLAMPVMNGWQFVDEFNRLNIDPIGKSKIYVLSSSLKKLDILKSNAEPRVENFLSKPIDFDKIKAVFYSN
ncbi:response regulator [Mucilaginibacter sp. CAU 1740]|uniref:response regulator n=1 Tax=Mucilaginibacter sp. CAU 1740 TaxID=3140365 RepID=UPI00325BAE86